MTATLAPVELTPAGAGRDEWLAARRQGIGASEIAAVLGISPWESRFSLHWRKRNGWEIDASDEMSAGTRLEPAIADWWADEHDPHENLAVIGAGLYAHPERPWQLATPDRLVCFGDCDWCDGAGLRLSPDGDEHRCQGCGGDGVQYPPVAVLECKYVAHSWDGWGNPGTDDIPVYYRAQVLQQCDVMGVGEWHLAALGPGGFRAYRGVRDERDLRVMRAAGAAFMADLEAERAPDLDSHTATLAALKRLHPSVEDRDVDVPVDLAEGYRRARALKARAEAVVDGYEARIRAAIGGGRRAKCNGRLVASRSVYDRKPYEVGPATIDRLNPGRSSSYA
jgi:putative phage-type endonuclease